MMSPMSEELDAPPKRRVLLIEHDRRFGTLVASLLKLARYEVEMVTDGVGARAQAAAGRFDAVVLGVDASAPAHAELLDWLIRYAPDLPLLVLTTGPDPAAAVDMLRRGARGYLVREDTAAQLAPALVELLAGGCPLSTSAARALVDALRCTTATAAALHAPLGVELTRREREVLSVLTRGLTYEQSAMVLGIGVNTIRTHVRAIYAKLGVGSRTEAVVLALRRGWVETDG